MNRRYDAERLDRWAEYALETYGCKGIPVDLRQMASRLNVVVEELPLSDNLSGVTIPMPDIPGYHLICINNRHARVRKRFTLAHELSHVILHSQVAAMTRGHTRAVSIEWEANRFAAALLMPRSAVRAAVARMGLDVVALACGFSVSQQAMTIRLEQLGYLKKRVC